LYRFGGYGFHASNELIAQPTVIEVVTKIFDNFLKPCETLDPHLPSEFCASFRTNHRRPIVLNDSHRIAAVHSGYCEANAALERIGRIWRR
jgi:hypothetical protein